MLPDCVVQDQQVFQEEGRAFAMLFLRDAVKEAFHTLLGRHLWIATLQCLEDYYIPLFILAR